MLVPYLRSLSLHSTSTSWHDLIVAASHGEVHSRGSDLHECFVTHLMSPIVNKGEKLYDSSSFAFSVLRGAFPKGEKFWEWVAWDLDSSLWQGELSVHSYGWALHIVRGCIWVKVFQVVLGLTSGFIACFCNKWFHCFLYKWFQWFLSLCLLLYRLCWTFASF